MAWNSTRDAPPASWPWEEELELELSVRVPLEEGVAVLIIDDVLQKYDGVGLRGTSVIDVGCGRGACLWAAQQLGAARLFGVDLDPWACRLTERNVPGVRAHCGDAASALAAGERASIVWSHGVVEHLDPDALREHLSAAIGMSDRWVAFSAPNPANGPYVEFVDNHLACETWPFGFEEPLQSYGPMLLDMGCKTVWDGSLGDASIDLALLYARMLPRARYDFWAQQFALGLVLGPATLVVATVPGVEL